MCGKNAALDIFQHWFCKLIKTIDFGRYFNKFQNLYQNKVDVNFIFWVCKALEVIIETVLLFIDSKIIVGNWWFLILEIIITVWVFKTRKSSCVTARGVLPTPPPPPAWSCPKCLSKTNWGAGGKGGGLPPICKGIPHPPPGPWVRPLYPHLT